VKKNLTTNPGVPTKAGTLRKKGKDGYPYNSRATVGTFKKGKTKSSLPIPA